MYIHRFKAQLTTSLIRVSGLQDLCIRVEEIRAESYQQSNQAHEAALLEVRPGLNDTALYCCVCA
jgi:hypothetical protein